MYKGDLKGFPTEVVNWMLDQQELQGNKKDVTIFEHNITSNKENGGFDWVTVNNNLQLNTFCLRILKEKDFDLFFKLISKKPIYPKIMWVSDAEEYLDMPSRRNKRVVFMEKNNKFLAWDKAETFEKAEFTTFISAWKYAKDIEEEPQLVELTMEDISAGKGVGVDPKLIRIKK